MASLGGVGCSLLGSPVSVFISCLMAASSLTGGFSSPWWPPSDPATSFSPLLELAFDLPEPSSLALLSSDECGEGKLSVSELLLAPPGKAQGKGADDKAGVCTMKYSSLSFHLWMEGQGGTKLQQGFQDCHCRTRSCPRLFYSSTTFSSLNRDFKSTIKCNQIHQLNH